MKEIHRMVNLLEVCIYIIPRRKVNSHNLREATVVSYQSGKGYKAISKQFEFLQRRIVCKWKASANLSRSGHPRKLNLSIQVNSGISGYQGRVARKKCFEQRDNDPKNNSKLLLDG